MRKKFFLPMMILSGITCAFILSCGAPKEVIVDSSPEQPLQVNFMTVGKGVLYGAGEEGIEEGNVIIRTKSDWDSVIQKMNAVNNVTDKFLESENDFSDYMLIACFDEVRPNGGYALKIKDITESETRVEVIIELTEPTGDNTSVMIQPFHIVKMPATEKEFVFVK